MQDSSDNTDFLIRWCGEAEIDWVNEQYQKVDFKLSRFNTDRIAITICNGERVGLARLCYVEDSVFELGGMYVQPSYRRLGIAKQLVRFLLNHRVLKDRVYCLPFVHLRNFYLHEGFKEVSEKELSKVPINVLEKYRWCNETYPYEVLLLQL